MEKAAEILRQINNLVRYGSIAEVDVEAARVRVQTGENLTDWLPWLTCRASTTTRWSPPVVGEQVLLLSPGGDINQAIALLGIYSDENPAPQNSADKEFSRLPDGTFFEYDHAQHKLTIDIMGDISLQVNGSVDATITGDLTGTVNGNLTANIDGDLTATVGGKADIDASGETTVDAPQIKFNGGAGVVTGAHICQYTGSPHSDCSSTVKAGK